MTTLASDPNRTSVQTAEQPGTTATSAVAPGPVEPGTCWALRRECDYRGDGTHFPTWEEANQAVTIDPDHSYRTYDVIDKVECSRTDCQRAHLVAEVAYRAYQHRRQVEKAAAEQARQDTEQEWRLAEASYREDRLRHQRRVADCAEQRLELQREEADRSEQRLQLQTDEADHRLQLELDQAEAQREQRAVEWAWRLVGHCAAEIGKADAKAGLVVTLQLGLIAAAGSGALGAAGLLHWAAIALLLIGVLIAAWAVRPRLPRRSRRTGEGQEGEEDVGLNFGVVRGLDAAELAARLLDVDELTAASAEAVDLAGITHAKYTWIWWSMAAGVAGLVLAVIAAAVGGW